MVKNVQGSASAAGSGEFHVYKHSRRREYERLKMMETKDKAVCADSSILLPMWLRSKGEAAG